MWYFEIISISLHEWKYCYITWSPSRVIFDQSHPKPSTFSDFDITNEFIYIFLYLML